MGNVKVEAKHYEQAIAEALQSLDAGDLGGGDMAHDAVTKLKQRARELAHAEQEKQE